MASESVAIEAPTEIKPAEGPPEAKPKKPRTPKKAAVSPEKPARVRTVRAETKGDTATTPRPEPSKCTIRVVKITTEGTGEEVAALAKGLAEMFRAD